MNMHETHSKHQVGPHHALALRDARGRTVTCLDGSAWLTMEGDHRDVVLEPGASFVIDRDGLTLLAAQRPSAVEVSAQNHPRSWWDHVVDYLDQTFGPAAIRRDLAWRYYNERNR